MVLRNSALKKLVRRPGYQEVTPGEFLYVNFLWVISSGLHWPNQMKSNLDQFSISIFSLI